MKVTDVGAVDKDHAKRPHAPENFRTWTQVIDFTTPQAVLATFEAASARAKKHVVGNHGWLQRSGSACSKLVEKSQLVFFTGATTFFRWGSKPCFSRRRETAGRNIAKFQFLEGNIFERHQRRKKKTPVGTAANAAKRLFVDDCGLREVEITSCRERARVVGMHEVVLDSPTTPATSVTDSQITPGFARGAVRARSGWPQKWGFFDSKTYGGDVRPISIHRPGPSIPLSQTDCHSERRSRTSAWPWVARKSKDPRQLRYRCARDCSSTNIWATPRKAR